jgi:hypothetical protein
MEMIAAFNRRDEMPKFVGKITRSDLQGGSFLLVTDGGVVYQLKGGGADLRVDGARAEIEGKIATNQVGLAMMGEVLEIKSYRLLA